jgi:hypothetical protein
VKAAHHQHEPKHHAAHPGGSPRILDIEDGLHYESFVDALCGFIVTNDRKYFHITVIPVMDAEDLLVKHVVHER